MKGKKYKLVLLLLDVIVIVTAILFSYWMKYRLLMATEYRYMQPVTLYPFILVLGSIIIIFKNSHLYKMNVLFDSYHQFVIFVKAVLISYGILITTLFLFKHPLLQERHLILLSFILIFIFMPFYRIFTAKNFMRYSLKKKIIGGRVILIGTGTKGEEIAKELLNNKYAYFTPIGFLDDNAAAGTILESIKVLDKTDKIEMYSEEFDEILITLANVSYNELQRVINLCRKVNKPIHIISDLYHVIPEKVEVEQFDGFRTFQVPPVTGFREFPYIIFKRLLDFMGALLIILLFLPVWITIAVLIKKGSSGPFFYKAQGIGYKEKPFIWYKFRTMYDKNDDSVHKQLIKDIVNGARPDGSKLQNDSRITPIGSFLRKYSIDEFPQLINVLKGEMSLIGPRPVLPYEFELLEDWQKEILTVLPGMTGLWQVRGRNQVNFEDQYVLDLYYVRNRSIWMDIEILINTLGVVLSGKSGV